MSKQDAILIVDDNVTNLKVLVETLTEAEFRIFVASNGQKALERVQYDPPDLVLLDVMMPDMNGFEVCRRLKEDPKTQDIPVIFITGLSDAEDKVEGFQTGGVDYITKPVQHEEVLARVRTHLALKHLQQNLEQQVAERTTELSEANTALQEAMLEVEALKDRL